MTAVEFNPEKLKTIAGNIPQPSNWRHWLWERSPKRPETQNAFPFWLICTGMVRRPSFDFMEAKTPTQTITISHPMDCRALHLSAPVDSMGLGIWYLCNPVDVNGTTTATQYHVLPEENR